MRKLFGVLTFFALPFMTFGDVLPEPNMLADNENNDIKIFEENGVNNENTIDNLSLEENNFDNTTIDENDFTEEDDFDPLTNIAFGFCDDKLENTTYSFNGIGEEGKPIKVCLIFQNLSDRDISIDASLYTTDYDDIGMVACTQDKSLSNFITSGDLGIITIPAENYIIKTFEITFPIGFSGEQNGCLGYRSPSEGVVEGIEFFVRKVFLMKFFIGSVDVKNELTITDLNTKFDDNNDLIMSFYVKNIGNMENTFVIQGAIKSLFGYNKSFEITDGQVAPGRLQYVEANLGSLPSYGGKFDIDFTINGTPYFSYDITNANVDPTWLEPKSWDFSTSVFKMPWLILAVVVIFIILLIVLFKKPKQKVIYVQQQPQQPVQPQQVSQQPTQQYTQPVQQPVQQPAQPVQQPQQPQNPNYPQN